MDTVKKNFKRVTFAKQVRSWAHSLNKGRGTYRKKIVRIYDFSLENFKSAVMLQIFCKSQK